MTGDSAPSIPTPAALKRPAGPPRPVAVGNEADSTPSPSMAFGRVESDGTVYLTAPDGEVKVGQYAAGTPEEGLAFFARKYDDLVVEIDLVTTRLAIKEVAMERDIYATFMPKPLEGHDGSGLHLHLSLFQGDDNAFHSDDGDDNLSETARSFVAGLLRHGREITAVTNQWVNSYKRLVTGFDAPVLSTWDRTNQAAVVRVPTTGGSRPGATRIEYRAPDPACNPYLALSVILAAGLTGVEEGYQLRTDTKAERLPTTLAEALDAMESSSLMKDALGEHVFEWFLRNKRREWQRYEHHVSRFELEQYLPVL